MRKIRNVEKTWEAVRAISPSDYHCYFFINLDTETPNDYFPNSTKIRRLDCITLNDINILINEKSTMFICIEEDNAK